ncbi:terminase large subunit [Aestuariivirga sp.]|uniref:terminase large subunit n=1 Tax=Aestuariivirga sp. TaxID=2650926 RepID=UPI003BAC89ED
MKVPDTYPAWLFDCSPIDDPLGHGERAIRFLHSLKHPKSRAPGQAFQLTPWQERLVRRIYGPCHPDGRRKVRNVLALLPRGGRKTSLGAGLALLHSFGPERIPGGQSLFAAADRKQARIGYEEALGILRADRKISGKVRALDYKNRLVHDKSANVLEAISADAATQHGRTPGFALVDELHAWKKRELYDVVRTGLVKVPGSLMCIISTAGRGQANVAWDLYDYARKVARGDIEDEGTLPVLFETPKDADWRDEELWHLVNPGLVDGFPDLEGLRQLAREAENRPADRDAFRQLHLNVWLDHSHDPFVDMAIYDNCRADIDEQELEGLPVWLGVDLSSNTDLTAIVACWRHDDDRYTVRAWFFCPADNLRRRSEIDGVPYVAWSDEGHITPTPGNVVDFRTVEDKIRELCDLFNVQEINFDPHMGRVMLSNLADDGLPAVEHRQGWISMSPAIKALEHAIVGGTFEHDGNPVLRWNFANIAVETDKAGNRSFHKGRSRDRIDGAVACAMALGRAASGETTKSIYTNVTQRPDGLLTFD